MAKANVGVLAVDGSVVSFRRRAQPFLIQLLLQGSLGIVLALRSSPVGDLIGGRALASGQIDDRPDLAALDSPEPVGALEVPCASCVPVQCPDPILTIAVIRILPIPRKVEPGCQCQDLSDQEYRGTIHLDFSRMTDLSCLSKWLFYRLAKDEIGSLFLCAFIKRAQENVENSPGNV